MSNRPRTGTYGILTVVGLGLLATMAPAGASVRGRRTTTAVLAGVTAYHAVKGHKKTALVGAAATAYAYKRTQDAKKAERREAWRRRHRARVRAYRSRHHRVMRRHHVRRVRRR